MFCFGQSNKNEINSLIKSLNSRLVSESPTSNEKFTFSVNRDGFLQIERIITAPKVAIRKFSYSFYLRDTEYSLDTQYHEGSTYYAFVFKDKSVKKNIKQVIKVKNLNSTLPEIVETDSFVTLIIPVTLNVKEEDVRNSSEIFNKIFKLAQKEDSYFSSYKR